MKVITISGKAQHGKDTAATNIKARLESEGAKVLIVHFADYLKFICEKYFGWDGQKDDKGRTLLQYIGTDVGRHANDNMWAKIVLEFLKGYSDMFDYVLIPDTRFPDEIQLMKDNFKTATILVRRLAFDNGLSEAQKNHPSETALDFYDFDYTMPVLETLACANVAVESMLNQVTNIR
jgi:hypothetical protein